jgi:D-mannonate dehydratase
VKGLEPPVEKIKVIQATAQEFDLNSNVFEKLLDVKAEKIKLSDEDMRRLFQAYLAEVRKLSKLVDVLGG